MGRLTRIVVTALAGGALTLTPVAAHAAPATSDAPTSDVAAAVPEILGQVHDAQIHDTRGITVTSVTKVSGLQRTWQINYSTPSIDPAQTFDGQMAIRVTLPAGYASHPDKHYPVLFGQAGQGRTDHRRCRPHHGDIGGWQGQLVLRLGGTSLAVTPTGCITISTR
ncbi:MAG: hypothetical protein E6924_10165 [Cutibacterium avidum]|nr:hypothetical protein [Cutibacterium avidum]